VTQTRATHIGFARSTHSGNFGDERTKKRILVLLALLPTFGLSQSKCIYQGERVSGLNKICTCKCATGEKSMTIVGTAMCPRSLS